MRRLAPDAVPAGEEQFHRRVWRHRVGADPATDVEVHGAGLDPTNYYDVRVSRDGRWLLVTASAGTAPRDDVWIADLTGDGALRSVQVGVDARAYPWIGPDGLLYLQTDRDAPRGRLVRVDPADPGVRELGRRGARVAGRGARRHRAALLRGRRRRRGRGAGRALPGRRRHAVLVGRRHGGPARARSPGSARAAWPG